MSVLVNRTVVFTELAAQIVSTGGTVGILVPSGIATDDTTKDFFAHLVDDQRLSIFYDFENKLGIFPDVHRSFRFATLVFYGHSHEKPIDFFFQAHSMEDLENKSRHIILSRRDIHLFNPNTHTCPIFPSKKDANLAKQIYSRIPVLVKKAQGEAGNPWRIHFRQGTFNQTSDAELFVEPTALKEKGFTLKGNQWIKGKAKYLPLYEPKMVRDYDHRFGSIYIEKENWVNQGQTYESTLVDHQEANFVVQPRWWVQATDVAGIIDLDEPALFGFRDITRATDTRTVIATAIPISATTNHFILLLTDQPIPLRLCLLANFNTFIFDYIARKKFGGVTLNFFIVEQLPTLLPDTYAEKCPWSKKQTLEQWISERVLKLTCTANDMIPLAKACNFNPPENLDPKSGGVPYVWKWKEQERAELRAQLDAAFFHLYQLSREDTLYILSTFQATGSPDDPHSTTSLIVSYFDQYSAP